MRGAGFAKLGLDDEAVVQGIARSGLEAFLDFDRVTIAAATHDWLSSKAMVGPYKHHRLFFQCVDRQTPSGLGSVTRAVAARLC